MFLLLSLCVFVLDKLDTISISLKSKYEQHVIIGESASEIKRVEINLRKINSVMNSFDRKIMTAKSS